MNIIKILVLFISIAIFNVFLMLTIAGMCVMLLFAEIIAFIYLTFKSFIILPNGGRTYSTGPG